MTLSPPRLHMPLALTSQHKEAIAQSLALPQSSLLAPAPGDTVSIPLSTAAAYFDFNAYIDVGFDGTSTYEPMIVDSGNNCLIVPRWEDIAHLAAYTVVEPNVIEPWGCPANRVRGPIVLSTVGGGAHTIPNCLFYACTADRPDKSYPPRTANFGTGCLRPNATAPALRSVLASEPVFTCAEFDYAPAQTVLSTTPDPKINPGSLLVLHRAMPAGYQVFDIVTGVINGMLVDWMSLQVKSLAIGGVQTAWPGAPFPLAMIDTGGGSVMLSDPARLLVAEQWPGHTDVPAGWFDQSVTCQATSAALTIELGDANGSYTYTVDTSAMPAAVQGRTLVMCQQNQYMRGLPGMNVGGISALTNSILIDYANARIGLKPKASLALV